MDGVQLAMSAALIEFDFGWGTSTPTVALWSIAGTASGTLSATAVDIGGFAITGVTAGTLNSVAVDVVGFSFVGASTSNLNDVAIDVSGFSITGNAAGVLLDTSVDVAAFALSGTANVLLVGGSIDVSQFNIAGAAAGNLSSTAIDSSLFNMIGIEADNIIMRDSAVAASGTSPLGASGASSLKSGRPQQHLWRQPELKRKSTDMLLAMMSAEFTINGISSAAFRSSLSTDVTKLSRNRMSREVALLLMSA